QTFGGAGQLQIENSTIAGNTAAFKGGGIAIFPFAGLTFNLISAIVAGNTDSKGNPDIYAPVVLANDSLVGVADGIASFSSNNLLSGTLATPLNAKLGPLQFNGGPTMTCALLAGSPAIDAGSNGGMLTSDQRGFARTVDNPTAVNVNDGTDIGAIELVALPAQVINVQINDNSAHRSMVTILKFFFDQSGNFSGPAVAAFQLQRQVVNDFVTLSVTNVDNSGPGTIVTLAFTGGAVDGLSLADGKYT